MRYNGWLHRTFARTLYWSFYPLPSIELKWIPRNKSFHIEAKWILFEAHLNFFFREFRD